MQKWNLGVLWAVYWAAGALILIVVVAGGIALGDWLIKWRRARIMKRLRQEWMKARPEWFKNGK